MGQQEILLDEMCRLAVHGNTEHYMKNITKNIVQVEDIPWELHPTPSRDRMWKTNFWPCGKTNKYRCWAGYNCMKPASKACIWFFTLVLTSLSQLSRVSFPIFSMELKSWTMQCFTNDLEPLILFEKCEEVISKWGQAEDVYLFLHEHAWFDTVCIGFVSYIRQGEILCYDRCFCNPVSSWNNELFWNLEITCVHF